MKTKQMILIIITIATLSLSGSAQETITSLTVREKEDAIEKICTLLNRFYVFPDVAKQMEKHIKSKLSSGAFQKITDPNEFASSVEQELRLVCHDKHLRLYFGINPDLQPKEDQVLRRILDRIGREVHNYGINRLEVLPGNVGYMSIRSVLFNEEVRELINTSMRFLSKTDAIIFDLRENGGGDPQYMAYLFSYFFDKPTHITGIYFRDRDRTIEFWTQEKIPGARMTEIPIFVLISHNTFSGAEEFAYDLQCLKRALVIGEVSAGGANPASSFVVYKDLRITIPLGRAINPITGTNWEGVGVKPDIEVVADSALIIAIDKAKYAAQGFHETKKNRTIADYNRLLSNITEAERCFKADSSIKAETLISSSLRNAVANKLYTQASVNQMGYDYLQQKNYSMAIAVLKFNVSAFPESANAYDSLGEAWLQSGDKDMARENYRKALELDPTLESAKKALSKIDNEK